MEQELYLPPKSQVVADTAEPSTRKLHCLVAWISGFLSVPTTYLALQAIGARTGNESLLSRFTTQDLVACCVVATLSALFAAPFRRLHLGLAVLFGFLPVGLVLLLAAVAFVYRHTA